MRGGQSGDQDNSCSRQREGVLLAQENYHKEGQEPKEKRLREKQWGPIVVKERHKRHVEDNKTVMEKAQDAKRKWNEAKGITKQKPSHVTSADLSNTASIIGIVGKDGYHVDSKLIKHLESLEEEKSKAHEERCDQNFCELVGNRSTEGDMDANQGFGLDPLDTEDNFELIRNRVEINMHRGRVVARNKRRIK
jgi:hypothetical protein